MEARRIMDIINLNAYANQDVSPPSRDYQLAMLEVMISSTMDEQRSELMERIMYCDDDELLRFKIFLG